MNRTCENCRWVHEETHRPCVLDAARTTWTIEAVPTIKTFCRRYPVQSETGPQYGCGEWQARSE